MQPQALSRRQFLAGSALLASGLALPSFAKGAAPALTLCERGEVQLLDSPLLTQFRQQQELYLSLGDDALLKPFRLRAGLPAPGPDMGGWYDETADFHFVPGDPHVDFHGYIPGHTFGQYVSGLARGFAATGDVRLQAKVAGLVEAYRPTISGRFFDDYNLPAYTYDKLVVGLLDAHRFAGVSGAKPALDAVTDAALPYLPEKALDRAEAAKRPHKREAQLWDETYTLPENLLLAYESGLGERYKSLGARYLMDQHLFDPLARGENVFGGLHAYSHVNALSSAVQAYLTLGSARHLDAARNGFSFIQAQSFATGGWGPNETLAGDSSGEALFQSLTKTHASFETPCGAYGHFKIARHLLRLTRDSRYGDSMERVLYNTILGARPTQPDGHTFYYSDYNERGHKGFHNDRWPCCSGTFVQLAADYGISAYLRDSTSLHVILYAPSRVTTTLGDREVTLTQQTSYPQGNRVLLAVDPKKPGRFAIALRIPAWAGPATRVAVNGRAVREKIVPGQFLRLDRQWRAGDRVELVLDQGLRLEALSDSHPDLVALMRGPRALFAAEKLEAALTRADLLSARADPAGGDLWRAGPEIAFKPFTAIEDEVYRLYQPVTG